MTPQEFDSRRWGANAKVFYRGAEYGVASVNFPERLLGLSDPGDDSGEDLIWVRCESVEVAA